jgi:hypothetical protein
LANGQELKFRYGLGGSQTKVYQLLKNQDGNGSEFKNKHHG